jgi:hypothetical protein
MIRSGAEIAALEHPDLETLEVWETDVVRACGFMFRWIANRSAASTAIGLVKRPPAARVPRYRQGAHMSRWWSAALAERSVQHPVGHGVQVIIGGEGGTRSLTTQPGALSYGVRGLASGVLGISRPRRMPYARAVSNVALCGPRDERHGGGPVGQTE